MSMCKYELRRLNGNDDEKDEDGYKRGNYM